MFTGWSVRRRLSTLAALITLVACVVGGTVITILTEAIIHEVITSQVADAAHRVAFNVRTLGPEKLRPTSTVEQVDLIQVVDGKGVIRQASARLTNLPPLTMVQPDSGDGPVPGKTCTTRVSGEKCLIFVGYRVKVGTDFWMAYAYAPSLPWYIHPLYLLSLVGGSLLLVGLSAYFTSVTVARALSPVKTIKDELAEITSTDLGRRVPPSRHRDEISDLADTVNQTLDRLEAAVEQQRRFASDASHDLRSPITAMRAQVEEARLYPEDTDWDQMSTALLSSLDRLQAIVADLLTLAKLDAGAPLKHEEVDLARLATEELDRRPRGRKLVRDLGPGVLVAADRLRLARLLTNLLDNAERHAEETITVTVRRQADEGVLEVLDDGSGIAPEQREVVFQRFTRLDASRNRDAGGTGLGLPIAREIARTHNGTLHLEDSAKGARFVLRLPIVRD